MNIFNFPTTKGFRIKISVKLVHQCMAILFNFPPTSNHLHPLQVENCGSNSRLVVDEDDHGKVRLERVKSASDERLVLLMLFGISLKAIDFVTWTVLNAQLFNPLTAKLFNLNFHPLEVVSRWRDSQLQVSENYLNLAKWGSTVFKYCWLLSHLSLSHV